MTFVACALAAFFSAKVSAQTVKEYSLVSGTLPTFITAGPDGALWFTDYDFPSTVNRITTGGTVTSFALPSTNEFTNGITTGPDGALWFAEGPSKIGRITTAGAVTEFALPTANAGPAGIVSGPDGALWFTEQGGTGSTQIPAKIGRITSSGAIQEFTLPVARSNPYGITVGPDGALWFAEHGCSYCSPVIPGKIGRISTAGVITEFTVRTGVFPLDITLGSDGALWFTHDAATGVQSTIGRIATDGSVTEFPISIPGDGGITLGPDGALWFTETNGYVPSAPAHIGRITTSGVETDFATPNPDGYGGFIAPGPDGNMWFTETYRDNIGSIALSQSDVLVHVSGNGTVTSAPANLSCTAFCGADFAVGQSVSLTATPASGWRFTGWSGACSGASCALAASTAIKSVTATFAPLPSPAGPLVAAVLPSSRSAKVGTTTTAFATMINAGSTTATSCSIVPSGPNPGGFSYQTTDSATNILTGTPNTPVSIPPSTAQSFVISFTPTAQLNPTNLSFNFSCGNADSATVTPGVNQLLLSASTTATPDVIALVATATSDGILHISGTAADGAFAVATANVGAGGSITASANTGGTTLPIELSICQTNPVTAVCLAPAGPSASGTIVANGTPTFSVFATATGSIPFAPGSSRIFVQFSDSSGVIRGSTSVAVETQ
jgi:virginiamycin B lyase